MKLINKKNITIALAVTILHFALTSAIGYYIAVRQGRQLGKIVTNGLSAAYEKSPHESPQKSDKEAKRISQKMKEKSEETRNRWEIPTTFISLPIKYFLEPLLNECSRERMKKIQSKEISVGQFKAEGLLIFSTANLANSFAFGVLFYAIIIIFSNKSKHSKQSKRTKNKPGRKSDRA